MIFRVEVGRDRDTWSLNACEQRQSLHSFSPIIALLVHVVLALKLYPFTVLRTPVRAPPDGVIVKSDPVGCARDAVYSRMCE